MYGWPLLSTKSICMHIYKPIDTCICACMRGWMGVSPPASDLQDPWGSDSEARIGMGVQGMQVQDPQFGFEGLAI